MENFDLKFRDFVGIYENIFSREECNQVIESFEKYHRQGLTYSRSSCHEIDDISLNLVDDVIEIEREPEFIKPFIQRYQEIIYPLYNRQFPILQNLSQHYPKILKIQKTHPCGGYHVWHCEHNGTKSNRLLSWILFLNDVEEGGETEFLYQSFRVKPKAGTLILFPSFFTHTHRGNPPLKGVKYLATGWIHLIETDQLMGQPPPPEHLRL